MFRHGLGRCDFRGVKRGHGHACSLLAWRFGALCGAAMASGNAAEKESRRGREEEKSRGKAQRSRSGEDERRWEDEKSREQEDEETTTKAKLYIK